MTTLRTRRALTLAIAVTTMIVPAGCNSNNHNEVHLTEKDFGRTVTLKRNEFLTLTLRSPVLPWRWEVTQSPEGIVKRSASEESRRASLRPKNSTPPIPGGPSETTFAFEGIAAGRVTLTLDIRRPDRKDEETKESFKIQVNVE